MKLAVHTLTAAALLVPLAALAQTQTPNQPMTRAEVRAQLVQVEQAGYNPARKDIKYPADIQAAEARIHGQPATAQSDMTGYGTMPSTSSQSGHSMTTPNVGGKPLYQHR